MLRGIQHVYADPSTRDRLFEILEEGILHGVSHTKGCPGMELWKILVMGPLKQGLGHDFDHLHELVNETVRKFLGHADIWDETGYGHQTVVDNVSQLTPEVLEKVSQLVAESGHAMVRKRKCGKDRRHVDDPLRGRCDSFVVETDVNLLWDAMRCLVRDTGRASMR